jgi:hypothetical protein
VILATICAISVSELTSLSSKTLHPSLSLSTAALQRRCLLQGTAVGNPVPMRHARLFSDAVGVELGGTAAVNARGATGKEGIERLVVRRRRRRTCLYPVIRWSCSPRGAMLFGLRLQLTGR